MDELQKKLVLTVMNAVIAWFSGKASIMVGKLPIRFKADPE